MKEQWWLSEDIRVLGLWRWLHYRYTYRQLMKLAHKFNWHHAPISHFDDTEMRWCQWCGFRSVIMRADAAKRLNEGAGK